MTKIQKANPKQSLLIGALASSFGVFISKMLGLLYYSPLSSLAGEGNMAFYSITYTYYDLLLKISQAGIPFAIAAIVAKYAAHDDYKTAMLVRKLGTSLVMAISVFSAFIFIFCSGPIARQSLGALASDADIANLKNLFMILILAVILVPYLSVIRSYYQGLKRLDLYASSQVLEQFVRVFFILLAGFVVVKVLKFDSIYAIYTAILAAGIAALVAIIFFKKSTREDDRTIEELVKRQEGDAVKAKYIFKEIIDLGVPYLLISFLGSSGPLVNTSFFLSHVTTAGGMPQEEAVLSLGILQANCSKLNAIPQVLTSGFCAGLVPYLTESLVKQDYKKMDKQIMQILNTVLYILIPVLFIFNFFARDVYYIMYGNSNLDLGTSLFRASNYYAFTETVLPILSSIMITLRLKKEAILTLLMCFILKLVSFFPMVKYFWAYGMVTSTCFASVISITVYLILLNRRFGIKFKQTFKVALLVIICSFIMVVPGILIHNLFGFGYDSRVIDILIMILCGIVMVTVYLVCSYFCYLPQALFGFKKSDIKRLIHKFFK
ncbi:MAG: oligosaccharide flippase family protein [Erysipelotrichaceae bacterium]